MQNINTMVHKMNTILWCFLVALAAMQAAEAVEYEVTNKAGESPGGVRFNNEIGLDYSKQALAASTEFIWRLFQQNDPADRRTTSKVSLVIEPLNGLAHSSADIIHFSSDYIASYSGDVRKEFTGVIYHEMTHSWQWNGAGQAPVGLVEGIADFVRMKGGYEPSSGWSQPGEGSKWDEGYVVTARFLDYCNGLRNGFVAELNKKMRTGYSVNFFDELLGKSVDQLWTDYKAKYGQ